MGAKLNKEEYYQGMVNKNIGVGGFSEEEQERIKSLKIAIAGAGGLGGPAAYLLARLGVKEIRIADPDTFEISNVGRQFGAYVDTIGENKAEAIKNELLRINPYLNVQSWNTAIDASNVEEFLEGVDAVVDGIDFFRLEAANILYKEATKRKLWCFTCQGAGFLISFLAFAPNGISFGEMINENGRLSLKKAVTKMFPILPKEVTPEVVNEVLNKKEEAHLASRSTLPPIGGALVVEEMIKILVKNEPPVAQAPDLFIIDLKNMKISLFKNGKIQRR